jgi:phage terminase small subunit
LAAVNGKGRNPCRSNSSDKQRRFVLEYMKDLNATQAAIRAGYSEKTAKQQGSRLLTNADLMTEVTKQRVKQEKRTEITADYVLNSIVEVVERCKQAVPSRDHEGNPTGEYSFEATAALKGLELLGRHKKLFTDKVEHSGAVTTDSGQRLAELLSQASERADNLSQ